MFSFTEGGECFSLSCELIIPRSITNVNILSEHNSHKEKKITRYVTNVNGRVSLFVSFSTKTVLSHSKKQFYITCLHLLVNCNVSFGIFCPRYIYLHYAHVIGMSYISSNGCVSHSVKQYRK